MINDLACTVIPSTSHTGKWQRALADAIRDPHELLDILELSHDKAVLEAAYRAHRLFPVLATRSYVKRIRPGRLDDPLLMQILPLNAELNTAPGYSRDPVGDLDAMPIPGLLHKYHGRVLLISTGACAIHCRYCFRREFPYPGANPKQSLWQQALDYLRADSQLHEVILSGGDPLTLGNEKLDYLLQQLSTIKHIKRVRIHSRLPIVLPERIDNGFLKLLSGHKRLQIIMVVHANHGREFDYTVSNSINEMRKAGVLLLNQAVLLKGINDSVEQLVNLSETLTENHIIPYYLHLLDRVRGTEHFEVNEQEAVKTMIELKNRLPGYMVPKLAREIPGRKAKTMILPEEYGY